MINKLKKLFKKEKGQGLVEYGLVLALIGVLSIGAVSGTGKTVAATFAKIGDAVDGVVYTDDSEFRWITTADHTGYTFDNEEGRGYYHYQGGEQEVIIPHSINGNTLKSYFRMFAGTNVETVVSTNPRVEDTNSMFDQSTAQHLDLSGMDTSNVWNMHSMFKNSDAKTIDLSGFNTQKVKSFGYMFYKAKVEALDVSSFNTRQGNAFDYMFYGTTFETIDLGSFDTRNAENIDSMFSHAGLTSLDIRHFDTRNVKYMGGLFNQSKITEIDLSNFDTRKLKQTHVMFAGSRFNHLDLSSFDTSSIVRDDRMFAGAKATGGYARTQADADMLNGSSNRPSTLTFTIKP